MQMFFWNLHKIPIHSYDLSENPTLYNLAKMHVKYDNDTANMYEIIDGFRQHLFDDYYLSEKISKEIFERNIITHFFNRRIEQETFIFFKLKFNQRLKDVLIKYNNLFDMIFKGTKLFDETTERTRDYTKDNTGAFSKANVNETIENLSNTTKDDLRYSDTPQNRISEVINGEYLSNYSYNQSNSDSERGQTDNAAETGDHKDKEVLHDHEKVTDSGNMIDKYKLYESFNNIMDMIYNDLEVCFLATD